MVGGKPSHNLLLTFRWASVRGMPGHSNLRSRGIREAYAPHLWHQETPAVKASSWEECTWSCSDPRQGLFLSQR